MDAEDKMLNPQFEAAHLRNTVNAARVTLNTLLNGRRGVSFEDLKDLHDRLKDVIVATNDHATARRAGYFGPTGEGEGPNWSSTPQVAPASPATQLEGAGGGGGEGPIEVRLDYHTLSTLVRGLRGELHFTS